MTAAAKMRSRAEELAATRAELERATRTTDLAQLTASIAHEIFNAFFATKPHGTGMGPSISRSIVESLVESHGGCLWAADNSPRGASFYFTLPASIAAR